MTYIYAIGLYAGAIGGATLIGLGYFKYKLKLEQMELAQPISDLKSLKEQAKNDKSVGLYCKILGVVKTNGSPLSAPVSDLK